MRTYGRIYNRDGTYRWVEVVTDANGQNDEVYLTTLAQVCSLNLGESPFFGNYGIPAKPSVVQQVFPDYYAFQIQQQFAPFFSSIIISKEDVVPAVGQAPYPAYLINVTTHQGVKIKMAIPV